MLENAIRTELEATAQMVPSITTDAKNLIASGGTVMVERVDACEIMGKSFDVEGVFEVNSDGRWRDYYDVRLVEERVAAELAVLT